MADGSGGGVFGGTDFMTKREEIFREFSEAGKPFVATTKPYKSTATFVASVVESGNGAAFIKFERQAVVLFNYQVGGAISDGIGAEFQAPNSWTNMQKGGQTNGATRYVIEGFSLTWRSPRFAYPTGSTGLTGYTDKIVKAWLFGLQAAALTNSPPVQGVDPAALFAPPQLHSPFNLEAAIAQALAKEASMTLQFDQENINLMGTMDEFPEGGASSYLRANGQPRVDNRYKCPEGYVWRESGKTDSTLNVNVNLAEPVIIPMTGLVVPAGGSTVIYPTQVAVDFSMRLHGIAVRPPSQN